MDKIDSFCLFDTPSELDRTPPERITLLRFGKNKLTKGGERMELDFSESDADMILDDFQQRGKDLVIDFEHQTLSGREAPAAGWIDKLEKTADGLVASVKYWTDKGKDYITRGEYRYWSPTIKKTRRNMFLHSVALTNHPALHGIPALVADDMGGVAQLEGDEDKSKETKTEVTQMERLKEIASGLGIQVDGMDELGLVDGIKNAIKAINDREQELAKKIEGMVAMSDLEATKKELAKLHAEQAIGKAKAEGKLTPELESWAGELALSDLGQFNKWLAVAPVLKPHAPMGKAPEGIEQSTESATISLSDDELKVYENMGLSLRAIEAIKSGKSAKK